MLATDILKAFDCFCHDLFIIKLYNDNLDISYLNFIQGYLSNRVKGMKVDSCYLLENIFSGVP